MKNILFTTIAIFSYTFINAQSNLKGTMHANAMVGVLTGTSSSEVNGTGISYKYRVTGSNFGAQFQYALEDSFSVGIGLESSAIDLEVKDISNNLNNQSLNLIKVSLSARYYLVNKDKINIFAGPTVGYASGRDENNFNVNLFSETKYSGLNYGLNTGGNYYFTENIGFILQISYEATNLKTTKLQPGNDDVEGKAKLSGFNFMGGLAFKF